jgi:1,4-alpha-glucan branching enzyme
VLSQANISAQTPVGATLAADGATFRVWAPQANAVYLHGVFGGQTFDQPSDDRLLQKDARGYWSGYQQGARDGDRYRFLVEGAGSSGPKRDPRARELELANFPDCFAVLRAGDGFPWHDQDLSFPIFPT